MGYTPGNDTGSRFRATEGFESKQSRVNHYPTQSHIMAI